MVIRGYPEEIRRPIQRIPVVEEPPAEVKPVYYIAQYPPTERIPLDPNLALITFGILAAVGIIALAVICKK